MRRIGIILFILILFIPFLFPEESSDWDLLNEYLDVQIGTRFKFTLWWFALMIDYDPVILLDGVSFFPAIAIISKETKFNYTKVSYNVIMAPYTKSVLGDIKQWDKNYADIFWKSDFAKNMDVTQEYLKEIYSLQSRKKWLPLIGSCGMAVAVFSIWGMATADVAGNLESSLILGAMLAGGCEITVIIINNVIKKKMMKIVENLKMQ